MHPQRTAAGRRDHLHLVDARGYRRGPSSVPGYRRKTPPANKGQRYPSQGPSVPEIVAVLDTFDTASLHGARNRAAVILLWRSGLRVSEMLDLHDQDLDETNGAIRVRNGKGGKSRIVGMDRPGWEGIALWRRQRVALPLGPIFCVVQGPTVGRRWGDNDVRKVVARAGQRADIGRRVHPHAFRHAHAAELAREGMPVPLIQRQLGHANPGVTGLYLASIAATEVVDAIGARKQPMVPAL